MVQNKNVRNALSLGLHILCFALTAVAFILLLTDPASAGANAAVSSFCSFSADACLLAAVSAVISIVTRLEMLRGKRPCMPVWSEALRLCAVSSVTLSALVVAFSIAPAAGNGLKEFYRGPELLFRCVLPALYIAELLLGGITELPFRANFLSLLPVAVYGVCVFLPAAAANKTVPDLAYFFDEGSPVDDKGLLLLFLLIAFIVSVLFWCLAGSFENLYKTGGRKKKEEEDRAGGGNETAQEFYQRRVIRLICALAPGVALLAAAVFTVLTLTGHFDMPILNLTVFDMCCLGYLPVALYISNTCFSRDGTVIESKVRLAKNTLTGLIILQWNLISYLAPFADFWAYAFLFAAIPALFLDRKVLLINELLLFFSMVLAWFLRGSALLPPSGPGFGTAVFLRLVAVALSFALLYVLVLLVEKVLLTTLDRISDYDPLTHTLNRRKLIRAVESALDTSNRIWVPCCIVIFDLDDFKKINDTYGHQTGDEVLRTFARILYTNVQSHDIVFRYGGEEFLVLYFCTPNYAEASAKRILKELSNYTFDFLPEEERITCTAGLSVSSRGMTPEEFIAVADKRLYEGKTSGKNRVVGE